MNLSNKRMTELGCLHILGFKAKKIGQVLKISEVHALEQMNIYLHNKYKGVF